MKIKIKDKEIEVEECKSVLSKARGLMFRKQSKPLLFSFKRARRRAIHSLFCKPFKAVWMKDGEIIEEKEIMPFCLSIKPKKPFTHLVEIPLKDNNKK